MPFNEFAYNRSVQQIEKKNEQDANKANRGRQLVRFEPGDWVLVHMRNERFPEQRRSKLMPRRDGPYQVIEKINDNAYKVDLLGEYGVSATFNVFDLSSFDVGDDSRLNPFEERGDDATNHQRIHWRFQLVQLLGLEIRSSKKLSMDFFKIHGLRWTSRGFVIIKIKS